MSGIKEGINGINVLIVRIRNTTANKLYIKCGGYVFVEIFKIFTYICAGRELSNNLFTHFS
jgi:hypothetical protein